MGKQTAVEWLISELSKPQYPEDIKKICDKALEMDEKQKTTNSSQFEISDEEIEKAAIKYADNEFDKTIEKDEWLAVKIDFMEACKWYREQLKQRK